MSSSPAVLEIKNLSLSFMINGKPAYAVHSVNLTLHKGEITALVGESGCGKTMTALSCMGLQPQNAEVSGSVKLGQTELLSLTEKQWRSVRSSRISMVFQEPLTALNPLLKIKRQVTEGAVAHGMDKKAAESRALELLAKTGLPAPRRIMECYPHQLSGGQRQRIMIAAAMMDSPDIIIADEPTASLDVTIQTQIMHLLKDLVHETDTALLIITHDLAMVRTMCTSVSVMYRGRIIESGSADSVFGSPLHPYTRALLNSVPSAARSGKKLSAISGSVPALGTEEIYGCGFAGRCSECFLPCMNSQPQHVLIRAADGGEHMVACWQYRQASDTADAAVVAESVSGERIQ